MAETDTDDQGSKTIVSKMAGLVGLYTIFVFLSGWTYFESYFWAFGLYARWLDLSVAEILTKGFVILFEKQGGWLWLIYIFVLVVPVLFEVVPRLRVHVVAQFLIACLMLVCLPLTYFVSSRAGSAAATENQGQSTRLPTIRFETKCGAFSGRLLFVKDHDFYVHGLTQDAGPKPPVDNCLTFSPAATNQFLYIFRSEDGHTVEILEQHGERP